jgi:soluble lytic murein transglycosylase-like protein
MNSKFPQSSANLRVFALILTCLFCAAAATAQEKSAPSAQPRTVITGENTAGSAGATVQVPSKTPAGENTNVLSDDGTADAAAIPPSGVSNQVTVKDATTTPDRTDRDAAKPANDYKSSLNSLSTLYQNEVQRLEQKNNQWKELFKDGLISRVEMEASDRALADARAKVEEAAKQIAEANKPAPVIAAGDAGPNLSASNQFWSTGSDRVDSLISYYGKQHGVDPYLIFCLMSQESKFSKIAISPKGAQGLMQLMPGTAARYGVTNPYDVAQNISGGTRYLKDLLKMFNGRVDLALAGYNAGENAVIKYGYTIPPYQETRNYVKLITKRYGATTAKVEGPKSKV